MTSSRGLRWPYAATDQTRSDVDNGTLLASHSRVLAPLRGYVDFDQRASQEPGEGLEVMRLADLTLAVEQESFLPLPGAVRAPPRPYRRQFLPLAHGLLPLLRPMRSAISSSPFPSRKGTAPYRP